MFSSLDGISVSPEKLMIASPITRESARTASCHRPILALKNRAEPGRKGCDAFATPCKYRRRFVRSSKTLQFLPFPHSGDFRGAAGIGSVCHDRRDVWALSLDRQGRRGRGGRCL